MTLSGLGPAENEDAADWLGDFAEKPRRRALRAGLHAARERAHRDVGVTNRSVRNDAVTPHERYDHPRALFGGTLLIASSLIAVMVRLGFTPRFAGMTEPSTT